ncbi:MAG: isoprenylcysteine carboxylmethyltransferase family protein [Pseudogulbenkiania sp.]|nr:isoprenylcysteine carboxylmethyltransferase family protein [Pseudogulbenkiania sp.]
MNDFAMHYGHWSWVAILVLFASWILYRFATPKSWREWAGAGLVQAFIIALYAEMYGFPLTIYLLTGFLGIDLPLTSYTGHLWATLLGYGRTGAVVEMLLGSVFIVFGLALLIIGWIQVYSAGRHGILATQGLYGVVRHPQYAGIMLAVFGQIIHWPTVITLALFPVIVFVYVRLARSEEVQLIARFGDAYVVYRRRLPMFLPRKTDVGRLLHALSYRYPE